MLKLRNLGSITRPSKTSRFSTKLDSDKANSPRYPTDPKQVESENADTDLPFFFSIFPKDLVSVNAISKLHSFKFSNFQLQTLTEWMEKKVAKQQLEDQSYVEERHKTLGSNLASAHFVVSRGGAIKFVGNDKWIKLEGKNYDLPGKFVPNLYVEAIDTTGMRLFYEGFQNLTNLNYLKYLKLHGNPNINDWCMDRLNIFKDSLEVLEIDQCPNVTERGLLILHRLRNLKMLKLGELSGVQHKELTGILLEDSLPNCKVEGINLIEVENQLLSSAFKK